MAFASFYHDVSGRSLNKIFKIHEDDHYQSMDISLQI